MKTVKMVNDVVAAAQPAIAAAAPYNIAAIHIYCTIRIFFAYIQF